MAGWENRIVAESDVDPRELKPHPENWRLHGDEQRDHFRQVAERVGFVRRIIASQRTKHVLNGHMRREQAIASKQPTVPVAWLDVSIAEERRILATFDPLGAMAEVDEERFAALLDETPFAALLWEHEPYDALIEPATVNVKEPERKMTATGPRNRAFYVYIPRELDVDAVREEIVEATREFAGVTVGGDD